jgi:DNA invertase Pin-like site-specific DNA recombinase
MNGPFSVARTGVRPLGEEAAHPTTALARLMLKVLGSLAEFERELAQSRGVEDRGPAGARGVKMRNRSGPSAHRLRHAKTRRKAG